jgi:hypothetical protein
MIFVLLIGESTLAQIFIYKHPKPAKQFQQL